MYIVYICILAPLIQNGFSLEETDLNSLSSYETLDQNSEIWNAILYQEDNTVWRFEEICKNSNETVYVKEEDITVDCKTWNEKPGKILSRVKRSRNDVEGSGEPEPEEKPEESLEKNEHTTVITTTTKGVVTTIQATENQNEIKTETSEEDSTTTNHAEATTTIENKKTVAVETVTEIQTTTPAQHTERKAETEITIKKIQTTTLAPQIENKSEINLTVSELPLQVLAQPEQKEAELEVPKKSDKEEDAKKQVEILEKHRGKTLISSQEAKEDNDKSIKTDESTQKAGSKDTTILVVLFVAVVVVGALAFGYNFIKKRKRQSADLERVERASIKRSLQNLTKPDNNEAEKKPLMDDNKEVEMVDMKKNNTEEKVENGPSEVKVQS